MYKANLLPERITHRKVTDDDGYGKGCRKVEFISFVGKRIGR